MSPTFTAIHIFQKRKRIRCEEQDEYDEVLEYLNIASKKCEIAAALNNGKKRTNAKKVAPTKGYLLVVGDNNLRLVTPQDSLWWVNYVVLPSDLLTTRQKMKFRRRYRMPNESWKDSVEKFNGSPI